MPTPLPLLLLLLLPSIPSIGESKSSAIDSDDKPTDVPTDEEPDEDAANVRTELCCCC